MLFILKYSAVEEADSQANKNILMLKLSSSTGNVNLLSNFTLFAKLKQVFQI